MLDKVEPSPAQVRLDASRARVRGALMEIAHPPRRPNSGLIDKLTGMVNDVPGVTFVLEAAKKWWQAHRDIAQTAGQASQALVTPIARRHPASLLGAAAAAGTAVGLLRPWRLLLRPKIFLGAAWLVASQAFRRRLLS